MDQSHTKGIITKAKVLIFSGGVMLLVAVYARRTHTPPRQILRILTISRQDMALPSAHGSIPTAIATCATPPSPA